jgi:hypothetical protein
MGGQIMPDWLSIGIGCAVAGVVVVAVIVALFRSAGD